MMAIIGTAIQKAAALLEGGKLVAIPTETVYGLGANAFDSNAVLSVFKAKNRPQFDPLIVHTHSVNEASKFADIPSELMLIASKIWPGPLTILAPKKENVHPLITAGSDLVAIRIPNHPLTLQLLEMLNFPIVAPSANPFGYVSPTSAQHVFNNLGDKIDYILDGGKCNIGIESTIISFQEGQIIVHRLGGTSIETLQNIGDAPIVLKTQNNSNPSAPGMLDKHYSPSKKLFIVDDFNSIKSDGNYAIITFGEQINAHKNVLELSKSGNLDEAAQNLFSILRSLDSMDIDEAYIKYLPKLGLGVAINDRIRRAAF